MKQNGLPILYSCSNDSLRSLIIFSMIQLNTILLNFLIKPSFSNLFTCPSLFLYFCLITAASMISFRYYFAFSFGPPRVPLSSRVILKSRIHSPRDEGKTDSLFDVHRIFRTYFRTIGNQSKSMLV